MDLLRSLPLGLYLEQPITWLHRLDPRVKFGWLMTFLVTPLLANLSWRIGIVVALLVLTLAARIPWRVLRQQVGWVLLFCVLVLGITAGMPDGTNLRYQPRLPSDELQFAQSPPSPTAPERRPWWNPLGLFASGDHSAPTPTPNLTKLSRKPYQYTLFHAGPVTITRRSLQLGIQIGSSYFTLIYSTTLFLLTTAPEEITAALDQFLRPLRRWKIPIIEVSLTLTLSLRFIPLVLEEVQNLIRSVSTRAINWQKLGFRGAAQLWLTVTDRLLENLFLRAEQIASAMTVRGFTSPNHHQVKWQQLRMRSLDWWALGLLGILLVVRVSIGVTAL
jgi:energy-coupling factor transport system permease protein